MFNMPINLQWLETDQPPVVHRVDSTRYATVTGASLDSALGLIAGARTPTVRVTGDGGFLLSGMSELATAVAHNPVLQ